MAEQYHSGRRTWVKLYVGEFLRGTIAELLTLEQQALFLKLLALAGDGREPGVVSPGKESGKYIGYTTARLAALINCPEEIIKETLPVLAKQNRITVDEAGVIRIVNWGKYQSDYLRQRDGRYSRKEKDVEREEKREENTAAPESAVPLHLDSTFLETTWAKPSSD
ncbi:MAG: phage replisome organizer N-terminal domain-containing protein [Terriglobia bacterium]